MLEDANARLRYQHEFSLAGFRALILINGGAIIGLLTYAGNVLDKESAGRLAAAFIAYVVGLTSTTVAYIAAYFSQGMAMQAMLHEATRMLDIVEDPVTTAAKAERGVAWTNRCIGAGLILVVLGLLSFVVGSVLAMKALT